MLLSQLKIILKDILDYKNIDVIANGKEKFARVETIEDIGILGIYSSIHVLRHFVQFEELEGRLPNFDELAVWMYDSDIWESSLIPPRIRSYGPQFDGFYAERWYRVLFEYARTGKEPTESIEELFLQQYPTGDSGRVCNIK